MRAVGAIAMFVVACEEKEPDSCLPEGEIPYYATCVVTATWYDGDEEVTGWNVALYDVNGQNTTYEEFDPDGNGLEARRNTFDELGNRVAFEADRDHDGTLDVTQEMTYDGCDQLTLSTYEAPDIEWVSTYTRDEEGRLLTSAFDVASGRTLVEWQWFEEEVGAPFFAELTIERDALGRDVAHHVTAMGEDASLFADRAVAWTWASEDDATSVQIDVQRGEEPAWRYDVVYASVLEDRTLRVSVDGLRGSGPDGTEDYVQTQEFNPAGRLTRRRVDSDANGAIEREDIWTYNANDQNVTITTDIFGDGVIEWSYQFDWDGAFLVEERHYDYEFEVLTARASYEFACE